MKTAQYDIACVGILCADVLAKPVDNIPEKGKLGLIEQMQLQIGGCAANAAIDLAKIGLHPLIVGKIGDDGFGQFLQDTLQEQGVDVRGLQRDPAVQTSASVVLISADGERSILHCLGSNARFSFENIDLKLVKQAGILFIAGTFLMPLFDGNGTARLLDVAQKAGLLCCMDTAWDSTGQWMRAIESTLGYLDWFLPSYEEAKALSGENDPGAMAKVFLAKGTKNVVIKLGQDGCYVKPETGPGVYFPAYTNIDVIDTSGAGDAFCAGFLTGLAKGWDVEQCATFANAVGAHCVMQIGTTTGIKSLTDTLSFIEHSGLLP